MVFLKAAMHQCDQRVKRHDVMLINQGEFSTVCLAGCCASVSTHGPEVQGKPLWNKA